MLWRLAVSAVLSEADPLGAATGPVAIDREVVYFDMTNWHRFGRAPPDFSDIR